MFHSGQGDSSTHKLAVHFQWQTPCLSIDIIARVYNEQAHFVHRPYTKADVSRWVFGKQTMLKKSRSKNKLCSAMTNVRICVSIESQMAPLCSFCSNPGLGFSSEFCGALVFPTSVVASLWIVTYLENRCPSRSQAPSSQSSCPHLAATRWQGNWGLPKLLSLKETKGQQHIIWEGCITDKKNPSQSLRVMQLTWKDRQQQWSKITGVQRKWHGNRKLMELLPPIHNIVHFAHPLGQFIPWWCLDRMWSVHTQAVAIFNILPH